MERQEWDQLPGIWESGKVIGRTAGNDGIERVRRARERYSRERNGRRIAGKHCVVPCALLCVLVSFAVSLEGAGQAAAAPETDTLIAEFPQSPGQYAASGDLPGPGAMQEPGDFQAPGTMQGAGTIQAPGSVRDTDGGQPPEAGSCSGPPASGDSPQLAGPPQTSAAVQGPVGQAPRMESPSGIPETLTQAEAVSAAGEDPKLEADPAGSTYTSLGTFEITGYCSCDKCCGVKEVKLTKSETVPRSSHTVATDLAVLPMGTRIMIDGVIYQVEDTGKAIRGRMVDIYFDSHQEALEFGRQQKTVYLVE